MALHKLHESGLSLDRFVAKHDLVLIKVGAEWCGPCRGIDPQLPALASDLEDSGVEVLDLDTEASTEAAAQLGVMGVPMAVFYVKGYIKAQHRVGDIHQLRKFADEQLEQCQAVA